MSNEVLDLMLPETWSKEQAREHFDQKTKELGLKHTFNFDEVYDLCMERRKKNEFRKSIVAFEEKLKSMPYSLGADPFPLKHEFADGMYIRTLTVPASTLTVTKIHGKTHPFFLQKGTVSILTEDGVKKHTAPYSGITKAGTKRVIFHHDEVVFTTVHKTNEVELDKIEDEIIAKDFSELDETIGNEQIDGFLKFISQEGDNMENNCLVIALREKGRDPSCLFSLELKDKLLPFKKSIDLIQKSNISLDGILFKRSSDGSFHANTSEGLPINEVMINDDDLVGTWVATAVVVAGAAYKSYNDQKTAKANKGLMGDLLNNQPTYQEDPNFTDTQKYLKDYSENMLQGNMPDWYKQIGEASPEIGGLVQANSNDILNGAMTAEASRGTGRSGDLGAGTMAALGNTSSKLRYDDWTRAMQGRYALLNTGLNGEAGVRSAAFSNMNNENAFDQNAFGQKIAITDQIAGINNQNAAGKDATANTITSAVGSAVGGSSGSGQIFGSMGDYTNNGSEVAGAGGYTNALTSVSGNNNTTNSPVLSGQGTASTNDWNSMLQSLMKAYQTGGK